MNLWSTVFKCSAAIIDCNVLAPAICQGLQELLPYFDVSKSIMKSRRCLQFYINLIMKDCQLNLNLEQIHFSGQFPAVID
jgi:hypothetical protein